MFTTDIDVGAVHFDVIQCLWKIPSEKLGIIL
jgi:hypothetical protein